MIRNFVAHGEEEITEPAAERFVEIADGLLTAVVAWHNRPPSSS